MKKITFIILAAVLVLALGIGIYYKTKVAKLPIEKILPEDALFYVRISEIEKGLEEFKSTRLWRNISNIDVESLLKKSNLTVEQVEQFATFKSQFFQFLAELLLNKYFGEELALAVYPTQLGRFDAEAMLALASNIILVTRVKPEAKFIEFVSKLLNKYGQELELSDAEYRGRQITNINLTDKVNISYVKIRDLLVIGFSQKATHTCLDVLSGEKPSLSQDKDYISTIAKLPQPSRTLVYGNLELVYSAVRGLFEIMPESKQLGPQQKVQILEAFNKAAGFKTVGSASVPGKISKNKTIMIFDKTKLDPMYARAYSLKPQKNSTINFVPKDIIGYQWNCFDPKLAWDNFHQGLAERAQEFPQGPQPADIIAGIEDKLEMSIENDIIPALGNEAGGFLADINLEGPFPIPEIVFFVKINDRTAVENLFNTLSQKNNLPMQSEQYQDRQIEYISLPLGKSLQPAYCFLDGYLLISTRPKLIKESIDALANQSMSLLANKDFQAINFGLTDKNNAVSFLKTDLLLGRIREICEWAVNWAALMSANLETYQQMAQQELNKLRTDIQIKEQDEKWLRTNSQALEEEIKSLHSQVLDVSSRQEELVRLEAKIKEKEETIGLAKQQLEEAEEQIKTAAQKSPLRNIDLTLVRLYLDEVVYPVLEGLKMNKAAGLRSTFGKNMLVTQSFYKTEEE